LAGYAGKLVVLVVMVMVQSAQCEAVHVNWYLLYLGVFVCVIRRVFTVKIRHASHFGSLRLKQ